MVKQLGVIFFLLYLLGLSYASALDVEKNYLEVTKCIDISIGVERLRCYDQVVGRIPPVPTEKIKNIPKPEEWLQAWSKEEGRSEGGFIETITPGNFQDSIFLTKPIENIGLVVFSCVDKISRVELMLDKPVVDGIIEVTIDGQKISKEKWLSDDTGFILRMGRGIPSINEMKNILNKDYITVTFDRISTVVAVDDLNNKIKSLRNSCRW